MGLGGYGLATDRREGTNPAAKLAILEDRRFAVLAGSQFAVFDCFENAGATSTDREGLAVLDARHELGMGFGFCHQCILNCLDAPNKNWAHPAWSRTSAGDAPYVVDQIDSREGRKVSVFLRRFLGLLGPN
jgi:hypothetical protein